MSDLRRWTEEGASPEETDLIHASRRERSSETSRRRMLAAVGLGVTTTTTAAAATGASSAAASGAAAGASILAKLGIGTVLVALAGGGALWATRTPRSTAAIGGAPPAASAEPPEPTAALPHGPSETTETAQPVADAPLENTKHPKPGAKSQLSIEVSALEVAQRALAHDGRAALRALDRYHAQFPHGSLAAEETVLRVRALLRLGEVDQATTLANAFSARYPESPYARRMQALIHGDP
jgi:hypothetical protein